MTQNPTSSNSGQVASVVNLPGYKILDVLGKGGMAIVYLAEQESIGRQVALKILVPDHTDETFTDRFLSEARIISSLNHPNIITVYDAGVHQGCHYMSMEYVPGKSLREARDLLSRKQKVQVIKQVAQALDYAGKKGYVHRDIKPENILLHEAGRAILTDFGIARSLHVTRGLTVTGKTIGTPYYMSPEQTKGIKVDHRSDIYSLGVVLFQALAGYLPYDGPSMVAIGIKHISDPIPELPPGLDIFQQIINIALSKEPAHRYATAGDFFNALDAISEADLDYIDAKAAALKNKGQDYREKTLSTSSSMAPPTPKPASDQIKIRAQRHTPASAVDITDTEEFKRLGRRRNGILIMLFLLVVAGLAFFQKDALQRFWHQQVQPDTQQAANNEAPRTETQAEPTTQSSPTKQAPSNESTNTPVTTPALRIDTNNVANDITYSSLPDLWQRIEREPAIAEKLAQEYHTQLEQDPNDTTARAGLEQLGKWYVLQIRTTMEQKNTTQARTLILQAKQNLTTAFVPAQLLLMEEQLLRQEAIQSHLEKAGQYYDLGQYISPPDQNARDEWLAVLSIDQNHTQARQGIESICKHYYAIASKQYQTTEYIEALATTELGLSADNQNPPLLALKHKLEAAIEKQNRILSLLIRAEAEFQAGNVITPDTENAFDLYNQVRNESAKNEQAREGLLKVEDYLNRQINTAIWENKLNQATQLLKEAQARYPNSAKLDHTQAKLQSAVQNRAPRVTHILFSELPISSLLKEQAPLPVCKTLHIGFTYTNLNKSTTLLIAKLIGPDNKVLEKKLIVSDKSGEHIFSIDHPHQVFTAGGYRFIIELDKKPILDTTVNIEPAKASLGANL